MFCTGTTLPTDSRVLSMAVARLGLTTAPSPTTIYDPVSNAFSRVRYGHSAAGRVTCPERRFGLYTGGLMEQCHQ
jgi:hypothetical protein